MEINKKTFNKVMEETDFKKFELLNNEFQTFIENIEEIKLEDRTIYLHKNTDKVILTKWPCDEEIEQKALIEHLLYDLVEENRQILIRRRKREIEKVFKNLKNEILEFDKLQSDYDTDFYPSLEVLQLSCKMFKDNAH